MKILRIMGLVAAICALVVGYSQSGPDKAVSFCFAVAVIAWREFIK